MALVLLPVTLALTTVVPVRVCVLVLQFAQVERHPHVVEAEVGQTPSVPPTSHPPGSFLHPRLDGSPGVVTPLTVRLSGGVAVPCRSVVCGAIPPVVPVLVGEGGSDRIRRRVATVA